MVAYALLSLIFLLLRAAGDIALVVIAYSTLKYLKFIVPTGPSFKERLKRALKAF